MNTGLLPTALVGSYPQPPWLVDRDMLLSNNPLRVHLREVWRPTEPLLEEAERAILTLGGEVLGEEAVGVSLRP